MRLRIAVRWLVVAPLVLVAGCAAAKGRPSVLLRPTVPSGAAVVAGAGFRATLPNGWTVQPAQQANGVTIYQIASADAVWLGEVAVIPIAGHVRPPGLTGDLLRQDIESLALQVTGTQKGSANVRTIEPMHLTNVAGETCAQFGVASVSLGGSSNGLSVTCRHAGAIYLALLESSTGTTKALNLEVGKIEAGWHWS